MLRSLICLIFFIIVPCVIAYDGYSSIAPDRGALISGLAAPSWGDSTGSCGPWDSDDSKDISSDELVSVINDWKKGARSMTELLRAIREWKDGC